MPNPDFIHSLHLLTLVPGRSDEDACIAGIPTHI
jgi:hypothetical protein